MKTRGKKGKYQQVVELYNQKMTTEEICKATGLSKSGVGYHINNYRKKIKEQSSFDDVFNKRDWIDIIMSYNFRTAFIDILVGLGIHRVASVFILQLWEQDMVANEASIKEAARYKKERKNARL